MRALLVVLFVCLASATMAATITVPDQDLGITEINQAMDLAVSGDEIVVSAGVYDSVRLYVTPIGVRTAVVSLKDGVTLRGVDREDVKIDQTNAEYGILCLDVGPGAVAENLTVRGGIARRDAPTVDGDGRALIAGIACVDGASPTITDVTIEGVSTGIVIRSDTQDSAPTLTGVEVARNDHHGIYIYMNGPTAVAVEHCTIVDNFDHGIYVFDGALEVSHANITHNGKNGIKAYASTPTVEFSNLYWNDSDSEVPLNYAGMDDLTGSFGNVSLEPYYCDYTGTAGYDYHVCFDSDIATLGEGGTYIGAWEAACTTCVSPVESTSWGAIKALYR